MIFLSLRIENIVGKGENAGYQHFLFPTMFSKGLFLRGVKRCHCVGIQCLCQGKKHCGKRRTHLSKEKMSMLKVLDLEKIINVFK